MPMKIIIEYSVDEDEAAQLVMGGRKEVEIPIANKMFLTVPIHYHKIPKIYLEKS